MTAEPLFVFARTDFVDFVSVIAWPLVVLIAIGVAVSDRGRLLLRPLLRRVRKIAGGGFTLELSEEAAAATKSDVEGAIREYSVKLRDEFDRLAHVEDVRNRMAGAVEAALDGHKMPDDADLRATVHIQDALYTQVLYQLVSYWPGGRGADRRYSTRFGILGRAWRLEESHYEPEVPTEPSKLIKEWGMTREQARQQARGRSSFVCILLRHGGSLVGILYIDALPPKAFPADIVGRIENSPEAEALAAAVGRVRHQVSRLGPGLTLLESD